MNICFLDFDGVFVNTVGTMTMKTTVDARCAALLQKVLKENDFKIVVSSTWRLGETFLTLSTYLKLAGINVGLHKDFKTCEKYSERGLQIQKWLDDHPEVENYVIIDDDSDMLNSQIEHFVHVDGREGFGVVNYYQTLKIIGKLEERNMYLSN